MALPTFEKLLHPLLTEIRDGKIHLIKDLVDALAQQFHITDEERWELLPSGKEPIFHNRVRWAIFYLRKAQLAESAGRGKVVITNIGKQEAESGTPVSSKYLAAKYKSFAEWMGGKTAEPLAQKQEVALNTPEENMEAAQEELTKNLVDELLEQMKQCNPRFFEQLVIDLLTAMGYGGSRKDAGKAIGKSGDGGIDGIINEDRLGMDVIYIQAKRWEGTVGRPEIQKFMGALAGNRARKGVFITTSSFSNDARTYAQSIDAKIVLIDGKQLAELMIEHDVGVSGQSTYTMKKMDADYFSEE